LPERDFSLQLSATNLQDFADCPRRFQLRHVLGVQWPVPAVEPVDAWEDRQRRAQGFHHLAQQYLLGISAEVLERTIDDPNVSRWWQAFREYVTDFKHMPVMAEVTLSVPFMGHRLYARYDALVVDFASEVRSASIQPADGSEANLIILDWKTYGRRPSRSWLENRLQTVVYPFVLSQGSRLFSEYSPIGLEGIEMRYWMAEDPHHPEAFRYDSQRRAADMARLGALVGEIDRFFQPDALGTGGGIWPLTPDLQQCRFCSYRSLCDRGSTVDEVTRDNIYDREDVEDDMEVGIEGSVGAQVAERALWQ
jgi:hypothetical protein